MELREGDFAAFFDTPFEIYGASSLYVSPMRSDLRRFYSVGDNPLFPVAGNFALLTAHRDRKPVGRIGVHVHPASNAVHKTNTAYFAYFDCADDAEGAHLLLQAAEGWARQRGFDTLSGNFNLTAMQQIGVVTDGFEAVPYVDQVYGPPHGPRLLRENGYEPYFPMRTFEAELGSFDPDSMLGPAQRELLASPDWSFAPMGRKDIPSRLEEARLLLNSGFANNPMFVPLTKEEFDFQARELRWIIDPRLTSVLHHKGEPAGIVLVIPDLNPFIRATRSRLSWTTPWHFLVHRLRRDRALVVYMSVRSDLQGRGVMGAMLGTLLPRMRDAGYKKLGITWIWDHNHGSLRQMERIGAKPLHRVHLFRKSLTTS
ncbi:GNAT family N-acetyltransferase [Pelagibacterium limicola]|uniref:GNAT family N-acetyltransferase n=1 Tax=Pelagibacterium limicola TaxID=2791022 RepID=UPI001A9B27AB|nr:GNAT family N-acetyltransferase [Pelagibacterium limicola]